MELAHKNLTLKELSQLALVEIFAQYQKDKGFELISMEEIGEKLGLTEFDDRIFQVTDFLEQSDYIHVEIRTEGGNAFVKLKPKAIIYLEETNDTTLNNTGNRRENIVYNFFNKVEKSQFNSNSNNVTQNNNEVNPDILDKLLEFVESSNAINISDKKDLFSDLNIIKNEIAKSKPDKSLIEKKVELMSKFVPLVPLLPKLTEWIKSIL